MGKRSAAEKRLDVAAAMRDTKDQHVLGFKAVHDDVLVHGHAAASDTKIATIYP